MSKIRKYFSAMESEIMQIKNSLGERKIAMVFISSYPAATQQMGRHDPSLPSSAAARMPG